MSTSTPSITTPLHSPLIVAVWALPLSLHVAATFYDNAQAARWALMLGLLATCFTTARLARHVVTRMAQIVALWEEDVPQHEGVAGLYAVPNRHRGNRAREQG